MQVIRPTTGIWDTMVVSMEMLKAKHPGWTEEQCRAELYRLIREHAESAVW